MKILHVITSLHTGGAEKLMVDLLPRIVEAGHDVELCVFDGTRTPFLEQLEKTGIKINWFHKGGSVYNPLNIYLLWRLMRKGWDIVHTHNTAPQLFAAISNIICSVTLVTTEHNTSNRRRAWSWYRLIDRWMYNRYQSVICISDAAESNLKKYLRYCNAHIATVYNGVNICSFTEAKPQVKLKQHSSGKIILVMVAGFREQKDQDTLIRAFEYLSKNKYELWLVGDGERKKTLELLVQEKNLKDNVRFLGLRNDIPQILKTADIVVMSSHFEGLSLSSIEGMAVGKPFIASDVDGLREITTGAGILFAHKEAQQLAKEIECLMDNKNYYNQVAEQCLKRAKEYDISKMIDGYERIYKILFENKSKVD